MTDQDHHAGLIESFQSCTAKEKTMSLILIFMFASSASIMIGVPILFKEPIIYCFDPLTPNNTYICTEQEACSGGHYFIDKVNGPKSLSTEFELICGNSSGKRFALTMSFFGFLVGCTVCTFIKIGPSTRKVFTSICGILYGAAMILIIFFENSLPIISLLLFMISFLFTFVNAFIYVFITENFVGDPASALMILVNIGWAFNGAFLAILAFLVASNFKIIIGLSGLIMVVVSFMFLIIRWEKSYEKTASSKSGGVLETFKEMWENSTIAKNFVVFNIVWPFYICCYTSVLVELESVGGSLYVNMILCSGLEIVAAFFASYLSKFDGGVVIKGLVSGLAVFFLLFFLAPTNIVQSSFYSVIFFISMMLCGKFCYDTLCLAVYVYLPRVMTDKYTPIYLIFSRLMSRMMNLFIPYVNLYVRKMGFHPFVFLGIVWFICRILLNFTKPVQIECVGELMQEFKVSIVHKLSIISGGKSLASIPHDDLLKNVRVKGIDLSVIRKSRFNTQSVMANNDKTNELTEQFLKSESLTEYKKKYLVEMQNK